MKRKPKTIVQKHTANFETLRRAFAAGAVTLVECTLAATGEKVATLCTVYQHEETGDVSMTPFAAFFNGNPFELLVPPTQEGDREQS